MKPSRDAAALAASLTSAAAAPLPLPPRPPATVVPMPQPEAETAPPERPVSRAKKAAKEKKGIDTVGITLRPSRDLLNRYTLAAAERTRKEGRVVSAQEIMLEVLERGRPQVQP
ncbi:MAG: hypothetical protein ACLP4V_33190 [Methylocella sp.]